MKGFLEFIKKRVVVGFAIGFIMGGAVSKLISALVSDIVNPVLGLILSRTRSLESMYFQVAGAQILWGHFISALIDFVIVAFVVYLIIKGFEKLEKNNQKKK